MDAWHYKPAADLNCPLLERLRQFPREPDMLCYALRSAAALTIRAWLRMYHRFAVVGRENLPASGSFVVVSNHTSHLDTLCLLSALPLNRLHQAFPAAAADYFFVSVPRIAVAAIVVNALPFHRELHVRQSLKLCRELLANEGNILILFPEGTRGRGGSVAAFKGGIAALLAGTDVPVVPCYLDGAAGALPKGSWLPRPRRIRLVIGKARNYRDVTADRESLDAIRADLRAAVVALSGTNEPCPAVPREHCLTGDVHPMSGTSTVR